MSATISYLTILGTSVAALFGLGWIALAAGGATLSALSFIEHYHYKARFSAVGMSDIYQSFALSNVSTSFVAAAAATALGTAVRAVAAA